MNLYYKNQFRLLFMFVFLMIGNLAYAQEVCDNGIDDDGDGLIDIQDEDCLCSPFFYQEVHGDFEDYICCPTNHTFLPSNPGIFCLDDGWSTSSYSTADYYNTCGFIGDGEGAEPGDQAPIIPMPIPSGNGAIGIFSSGDYFEDFGLCLDNPMIAGETYNLSFYIGFKSNLDLRSRLNISVNMYGALDCSDIGIQSGAFGSNCLENNLGWDVISTIPVQGVSDDSWLFVETTITPTSNYTAIAFGLACNFFNNKNYHFFDDIKISGNFSSDTPPPPGDPITSGNCIDGVSVELPNPNGSQFQWYLDGIAVPGATTNPYLITDSNAEGSYQILVTNGGNCSISNSIEINIDSEVIDIDGVIKDVSCKTENDGIIDIFYNSDNGPFQFEWSNNTNSEDILAGESGTYNVTVTDDHGCFGTETFYISEPQNINATVTGDCVNGVFISVFDNIPGAMYQWYLNGTIITGADTNPYKITSSTPGNYSVVVTHANGCLESNPIQVSIDLGVLGFSGDVTDLRCHGIPTGSIDVVTDETNLPHTYQWSNGEETQDIDNLEADDYTVTVTDNNGCYGIMTFTVNSPSALVNTLSVIQPSMGNLGEAGVTSVGGTMPITYAWSNGHDEASDDNLEPGEYMITVTDGNDCEEILVFEIESIFMVTEMIKEESCYEECDGAVTLTVIGNGTNYSVIWDDAALTGFEISNLCSGSYSYTVTDSEGTPVIGTVELDGLDQTLITSDYPIMLCAGEENGIIALSLTGGSPPYSYEWNDGSTNDTLYNVGAGDYLVSVTDNLGCITVDTITIDSIPRLELSFDTGLTGCNGEAEGTIDLSILNGTGPFDIQWSNDSITEDLDNLLEGWYYVTVTDVTGCARNDSSYVGANSGIELASTVSEINCIGEEDGFISLDISGGSPPFEIIWDNDSTTTSINNLSSGDYSVTISDDSGCSLMATYSIEINSTLTIATEVVHNNCFGEEGGRINLTIENANSPYNIIWEEGSISEDRLNLPRGEYSYMLTDSFGCQYIDTIRITEGLAINYGSELISPGCNGGNDGQITILPIGGEFPFSYLWDTGDTMNPLENLTSGNYIVTITDAIGCESIDTFNLSENSNIEVTETIMNNECYGEEKGIIGLAITGGTPPYDIIWDDNTNLPTREDLGSGEYFVTISDAIDCSSIFNYEILEPDSLTITSNIDRPLCFDDIGSIEVEANGGIFPYEYNWSTNESGQSIEALAGTTYELTLIDANGCEQTASYMIDAITELQVTIESMVNPSASNDDGSITIAITGGSPGYTVIWDNGLIGGSISGLGVGEYTATITDENGCMQEITVSLTNAPLGFTGLQTDNLCYGFCTGMVTLEITGGQSPYTILWNNGDVGRIASNLCNGDYRATITDASGTEVETDNYGITSPSNIIIDGEAYDISCINMNDGSVFIETEGGSEPFSYNWNNNMNGDSLTNLASGEYKVTVIDDNGCTESSIYTIEDISLIALTVEVLPQECDTPLGKILVSGENTYDYPYLIDGQRVEADNKGEINNLAVGSHTLSYAINETCVINVETFIIEALPNDEITLTNEINTVKEGETVILTLTIEEDSTNMNYTIDWNTTNPASCVMEDENGECITLEITGIESEEIEVVLTDENGCETILYSTIRIQEKALEIFVPNIFSPNNDGVNDEITITSNDEELYIKSYQIYDRWGNVVYQQSNISLSELRSWNGEYNGKKVSPNIFVYRIEAEFKNGKSKVLFGDIAVVY